MGSVRKSCQRESEIHSSVLHVKFVALTASHFSWGQWPGAGEIRIWIWFTWVPDQTPCGIRVYSPILKSCLKCCKDTFRLSLGNWTALSRKVASCWLVPMTTIAVHETGMPYVATGSRDYAINVADKLIL